ncbi:adenosylcobinamide-GDP ribazoletransferase [Granulosicoccus sp. 3-233]|uniref:adenosylcobinamide-GDP ribazoletransferase n=1 Tax=Granulosicoccus sp. 3-233 TaxID=3417969 RepID=UPI003D34233C
MQELNRLATAIMFLTRLPTGTLASGEATELVRSTRYFPLVGFIVGSMLAASLAILQQLLPISVSIALMLLLSVRLTGAFHEDGLADVADSAGAFGVDRKLEIMRDSRVGTYGALALILLVVIKLLSLWELWMLAPQLCLATLICAHVLSRWSSVCLMVLEEYARPEAANKVVAEGVDRRCLLHASLCTAAVLLPLALWQGAGLYLLFIVAWLVVLLSGRRFRAVFGGITGDCLGAANQVVEVTVLLSVLMVVSWH